MIASHPRGSFSVMLHPNLRAVSALDELGDYSGIALLRDADDILAIFLDDTFCAMRYNPILAPEHAAIASDRSARDQRRCPWRGPAPNSWPLLTTGCKM